MFAFSRFTVRYKLLTILLFSVVASLLLSGIWLSIYVEDYETAYKHREFDSIFLDVSNALISEKNKLSTQTQNLVLDKELIASFHIISKYQDPANYQALIFDQEKKNTLNKIHWFMATASASSIKLYDSDMHLVSFYQNNGVEQGFVSYIKARPVVMSSSDYGVTWMESNENGVLLKGDLKRTQSSSDYKVDNTGQIVVEYTSPVVRIRHDQKRDIVGFVVANIIIESQDLFRSSADLSMDIFSEDELLDIISGSSPKPLSTIVPDIFSRIDKYNTSQVYVLNNRLYTFRKFSLSDAERKYFSLSVDYRLITQRIRNIQYVLGLLLIVSALLVIPLALYVSRKYFTLPIGKLVDVATTVKTGDYNKKIEIDTGDEFQLLASAFWEAFHEIDKREKSYMELHSQLERKVEERTVSLQNEIAEKKKAEKLLLYSKTLLQMVINSIPQYIFWKDLEGRYLGCNTHYANLIGFENSADVENKTDAELSLNGEDVQQRLQLEKQVIVKGQPLLHDMRTLNTEDNKRIYLDANIIPLSESEDNVIGILGTYDDVTQRIDFENKLIEAKEISEQASRSKSEFLSRMSHELRTPMNAILGFSQLLQLDPDISSNSTYKDWIDEIMSAGKHLLELINEVLDLSSIESGKEIIDCVPVSILNAIEKSISIVGADAEKGHISIHNHIENDLFVQANELKLTQVVLNLLSNAVKYNSVNGRVDINSKLEHDKLTITICDTGLGIAEDDISRLFSPFERLDKTYSDIEGTGIGLAVSKRLIEAMGGKIGLDSEIGQGTSFWFTLPVTRR